MCALFAISELNMPSRISPLNGCVDHPFAGKHCANCQRCSLIFEMNFIIDYPQSRLIWIAARHGWRKPDDLQERNSSFIFALYNIARALPFISASSSTVSSSHTLINMYISWSHDVFRSTYRELAHVNELQISLTTYRNRHLRFNLNHFQQTNYVDNNFTRNFWNAFERRKS